MRKDMGKYHLRGHFHNLERRNHKKKVHRQLDTGKCHLSRQFHNPNCQAHHKNVHHQLEL